MQDCRGAGEEWEENWDFDEEPSYNVRIWSGLEIDLSMFGISCGYSDGYMVDIQPILEEKRRQEYGR